MKRTKGLSKPSDGALHRGSWTPEEDRILKTYIEANGVGRWSTLPQNAGLMRRGKSCRLRWMNHLRPNVKRGHISPDEEELIIRLHNLLGNRWSLIAGRVPGRTDNEVKNYWNTRLSKKLGTTSKNLAGSLARRQIAKASPRIGVDNNAAVDLNSESANFKSTPRLRSPTGSTFLSDVQLSSPECNNDNDRRTTTVVKDDVVHLAPLDVAQTNPCAVPPPEEIDQCTVQESGFVEQNDDMNSLNKEQGPDSFLTPYNTCLDSLLWFNYFQEMDDLFHCDYAQETSFSVSVSDHLQYASFGSQFGDDLIS